MNIQNLFKRITSVFRPEKLRSMLAIIVGAGSGGGRVATELGRLGLPLILIDLPGEKLEEHNIVRHELGYASLDKPKITELARHIRNLNPETPVECVELDVTTQKAEFIRLVEQRHPDVIVAATDNLASKHAINEAALRHCVPVVGAGVYDGGIAGECYITRPSDACFACLATHLKLHEISPQKTAAIDYNNLDLDAIRSTAALNLDIAQIALIQSRVVLNLLLRGDPDLIGIQDQYNLIVFANRRVPGHFDRPLHADFIHFSRLSDCLVCGNPATPDIANEADQILAALNRNPMAHLS